MELTNSTGSLAVQDTMASIATSPATFDLSEESRDLDSLFMSTPTPTTGPTTPSKTPHTASTTPSSSGRKLPVLRHLGSPLRKGGVVRRVYTSPESFVRKLRMLGSGEGNASPEKPLGTPIMQRPMTVRGRARK
ncbi:hypothetical protein M405DRAFT_816613 [Rhizopogon salebrosus TDB-379]|nr:hypothetical protein M405DRAFT_816613 [Rhizopogon salebrosus TDB-379]